ncbi:scavenger receptor cysteine-rich type 1 protein M130-like [Scyliorhinus canicula]|uniref:scavenger receptor cysteine-rich type 1 protein M130-like n=1 Tax=Scyliorhinus canicula TaxID=7830 RepID=UPI0018F37430|nr:scavenger receptor cysteine-rich type 1 protein M130-like [Scyliorhinus canicula]
MDDARVVCRQLGCGPPLLAPGGAAFGQGNGTTWLDEVMCTGNESFLSDCPLSLWPQADCDHKEDASVVCSDTLFFPTSSLSTPEDPVSVDYDDAGTETIDSQCGHLLQDPGSDDLIALGNFGGDLHTLDNS